MTEPPADLVVAIGEVASDYGLRLSVGDHAAVARRIAERDRGVLTPRDVTSALEQQGVQAPKGFAGDLIKRWSGLMPPKSLLDILLEYRLDAIDAMSADYGGKKKAEETLRTSIRMYLKGRHHVEARTGRGFTDLLIPSRRAVIEAKVWTTPQKYEDGLVELSEYIRTARPTTREAFFVLFCDDEPLPSVVPSVHTAVIDTRELSGLRVPVIAVPFQVIAPSKKAYEVRRRATGGR